ncbi:helix-turn-helix domain-containing protein [Pseudoroseicyclus sp. H15]
MTIALSTAQAEAPVPQPPLTRGATMSYAPVEAVRRALIILRHLNTLRTASVGDIHRASGICKPTIVRMLETLIAEGYVVRDTLQGGYRVTSQVTALSSGFDSTPLLIEAARDAAVELSRTFKWPVSIATADAGEMEVQFSTSSIVPYSFPFPVLHTRLSILFSAFGRCYFAFCGKDEREALVRTHGQSWLRAGRTMDIRRALDAVESIQAAGYALPDVSWEVRRFQFVAVPIMDGPRCLGALGTGFYRRAIPASEIEERIVGPVAEAARAISAEVTRVRGTILAASQKEKAT